MEDYIGKRFGALTVYKPQGRNGYICLCDCNSPTCKKSVYMKTENLLKGLVKRCGDTKKISHIRMRNKKRQEAGVSNNVKPGYQRMFINLLTAATTAGYHVFIRQKMYEKLCKSPCVSCGTKATLHPTHGVIANYVTRVDHNKDLTEDNVTVLCPSCRSLPLDKQNQ